VAGASLALLPSVNQPALVAALAWLVAGYGMGLSYPTITLEVLALAPGGREGEASAAMQLSDMLGTALGTGLGGAAVAISVEAGSSRRAGVAVAFALTLVAGVVGVAVSRRFGAPATTTAPATP
jgi:hypothetical protein